MAAHQSVAARYGSVTASDVPAVVDNWMAAGTLLPGQMPSPAADWSPEKRLAAAILAAALSEVRFYAGRQSHRRQVRETLLWILADDSEWPFSFLRLCALFGLDPGWVRAVVKQWQIPSGAKRKHIVYRHAA